MALMYCGILLVDCVVYSPWLTLLCGCDRNRIASIDVYIVIMIKYFLPLIALLVGCNMAATNSNKTLESASNENGPVVLELFTSQGCSSCPPADRLLGTLSQQKNVYALSFHVDYWDRLGWKDPFSKAEWSARQNDYAGKFGLNGVYTPQIVVNGIKEMVGSEETTINKTIKSMSNFSSDKVMIDSIVLSGDKAVIKYQIAGDIKGKSIVAALIMDKASTVIKAGENDGKTLVNYNVVLDLKSDAANKSGDIEITISPEAFDIHHGVVLFIQDNATGKITSADKKMLR